MVGVRSRAVPVVVGALAIFASAITPAIACSNGVDPAASLRQQSISAEDLISLREIGHPDSALFGLPSPIAIDPSGTRVAFVINQADPIANVYCRSVAVLTLRGRSTVRLVDRGGDLPVANAVRAGVLVASGSPIVVIPQWSPDGTKLAYLRRDRGSTQIWVATPDGVVGRQLTRSDTDVEAFTWSPDGRAIRFQTRSAQRDVDRAEAIEALSGFLYDGRFVPSTSARPQPMARTAASWFTVGIDDGRVRVDTAAAAAASTSLAPPRWRAETAAVLPSPFSDRRIVAISPSGDKHVCRAAACQGRITDVWANGAGGDVIFLRREGWASESIAVYRWRRHTGTPINILRSDAVLNGCTLATDELICLRESSNQPRQIVGIHLRTRAIREIFDPNPQTRSWTFGRTRRLHWKNNRGLEVRGDLVLPPGIDQPRKLPLIVVQYRSTGFLRGGTGDEYPIQLFARAGFAVLSVERPIAVAAESPEIRTAADINAYNLKDWGERRSLLSAIETGVRAVVDLGIADPARIGITGLSDGATTTRFALINSSMFAAAAMSSCCVDPQNVLTMVGPGYAAEARQIGYPPLTAPDTRQWQPMSFGPNAARVTTPLLMQLADDEYLLALDSYMSLREHNQPVEMFVFPDEHHIKVQPRHRLAIYRRSIDWFAFWLQGRETITTGDAKQLVRWRALRDRRGQTPLPPAPVITVPTPPSSPHRATEGSVESRNP